MNKLLLSMILLGLSFFAGNVSAAQSNQPAKPYDICSMTTDDIDDTDDNELGLQASSREGSLIGKPNGDGGDDEEEYSEDDDDDDDDDDESYDEDEE